MSSECEDSEEGTRSPSNSKSLESSSLSEAVSDRSLLISQALENCGKGKRKDYDALVQKLGDPLLKPINLQHYLRALRGCVSSLTKKYDTLIGTVLKVNWAMADNETVNEFIEFLTTLVSAQTYYLRACLRMLTKLFLPNIPKDIEGQDIDEEGVLIKLILIQVNNPSTLEQERVFTNAHTGLQAVLKIVPMTPTFLLPVLSENLPYIKKKTAFQTSYVKNLLNITQYVPSLREQILEMVINHTTKIDVEVPKHELEDSNLEDDTTQFQVDLETNKDDRLVADGQQLDEAQEQLPLDSEMGEKLDMLMDILFKFFKELCHTDGKFNIDSSTELFRQLIMVFERVILPTHACCHVQFIMFYICSLNEVFANTFLEVCWKKVEDPNTVAILRQACVAYMASLVTRAKYIPISTVQVCLELLTHWVHCYIDDHDPSCSGPEVAKHGPFYSVCQSIFYMFVFRHRQLLELEGGHKFIRKLNFDRIVTCRLNPLKVCLPTVVNLFALVTRLHEVVLCYTVIEKNKRSMLPISTPSSNKAMSHLTAFNQLDSFFPFDPYLLRRSAKYVKPLYQEWEGVEEDDHVEDESTEKDKGFDSEDEESEEYMEYGKTPDVDVPELSPDMAMSVSPGFVISTPSHTENDAKLRHRATKY